MFLLTLKTEKYKIKIFMQRSLSGLQRNLANMHGPSLAMRCYELLSSRLLLLRVISIMGSKYLEVRFHNLGFSVLRNFFMKMLKRVRKDVSVI